MKLELNRYLILLKCLIITSVMSNYSFALTYNTKKKNPILIGLTFSPDYCYRTLVPNKSEQNDITSWLLENKNLREDPKFGFTTGVNMLYELDEKVWFETAVLFSNHGEKVKEQMLTFETYDANSPLTAKFNYSYNYLKIPVKINYLLFTGKLKFFLSGGFSTNIFLYQSSITILTYADGEQESSKTNTNTNKETLPINLSAQIGCGINYDLNSKLLFRMEPIYRRSLTPTANASIKSYLYSFGVNLSIYLKIL